MDSSQQFFELTELIKLQYGAIDARTKKLNQIIKSNNDTIAERLETIEHKTDNVVATQAALEKKMNKKIREVRKLLKESILRDSKIDLELEEEEGLVFNKKSTTTKEPPRKVRKSRNVPTAPHTQGAASASTDPLPGGEEGSPEVLSSEMDDMIEDPEHELDEQATIVKSMTNNDYDEKLWKLCLFTRAIEYRDGIEIKIMNDGDEWEDNKYGKVVACQASVRYSPSCDGRFIQFLGTRYDYGIKTGQSYSAEYLESHLALYDLVRSYYVTSGGVKLDFREMKNFKVLARKPEPSLIRKSADEQEDSATYEHVPYEELYTKDVFAGRKMLDFSRMPFDKISLVGQIDEKISVHMICISKPENPMPYSVVIGNIPLSLEKSGVKSYDDFIDKNTICIYKIIDKLVNNEGGKRIDAYAFRDDLKFYPADSYAATGCGFAVVGFDTMENRQEFCRKCISEELTFAEQRLIHCWLYESYLTRISSSQFYPNKLKPISDYERALYGLPIPEKQKLVYRDIIASTSMISTTPYSNDIFSPLDLQPNLSPAPQISSISNQRANVSISNTPQKSVSASSSSSGRRYSIGLGGCPESTRTSLHELPKQQLNEVLDDCTTVFLTNTPTPNIVSSSGNSAMNGLIIPSSTSAVSLKLPTSVGNSIIPQRTTPTLANSPTSLGSTTTTTSNLQQNTSPEDNIRIVRTNIVQVVDLPENTTIAPTLPAAIIKVNGDKRKKIGREFNEF